MKPIGDAFLRNFWIIVFQVLQLRLTQPLFPLKEIVVQLSGNLRFPTAVYQLQATLYVILSIIIPLNNS